jgi:reactive intermediate/imine deaminase
MVDAAPTPVGPFSHAAEADGWVFLTGQMPTDPNDDAAPLPEGVAAQTRRVMDNLVLVLNGVGLTLDNVVSVRIFLTEFKRDYDAMNAVYRSYFLPKPLPARTCIGVTGLARDALVEASTQRKVRLMRSPRAPGSFGTRCTHSCCVRPRITSRLPCVSASVCVACVRA